MKIIIASIKHTHFANEISKCIDDSAKVRGTGIARRSPVYILNKIKSGNAVIATNYNKFAGFCYIEVWGEGKYVAHSGLIVAPEYRGLGLAKKIKKKVFDLSKKMPKILEDLRGQIDDLENKKLIPLALHNWINSSDSQKQKLLTKAARELQDTYDAESLEP